jgi:hypothetical protein
MQTTTEVVGEVSNPIRNLDVLHVEGITGSVGSHFYWLVRIGDIEDEHAVPSLGTDVGVMAVSPHPGVALKGGIGVGVGAQGDVNALGKSRRGS